MTLHVHRNAQRLLEARYQLEGHIGVENAGHILDGQGLGAHVFDLLRQIDPHFQRVHRAGGIGNGALGMLADLPHRLECGLQVAGVIHRVEDAEHIHPVGRRALDELLHHVISIVPIAQQILTAQQHLLAGIGHGFFQLTDTLPRIFSQIANTGVEGRATPGFDRPEADLVQLAGDRQHVFKTHAGSEDGLVRIAQDDVGDT